MLTIALCATSCRSSKKLTTTTQTDRAEGRQEQTEQTAHEREAEHLEIRISDTTTTISESGTATTIRHGVVRAERTQEGWKEAETEVREERTEHETETAEREETRQQVRREEGVGLTGFAFGAASCLALVLLTKIVTKKIRR